MKPSVALRERGRIPVLLSSLLQQARTQPAWLEPDHRNLRTWRQLLLAILLQRSTRLLLCERRPSISRAGTKAP
jgi:hypothetical protein